MNTLELIKSIIRNRRNERLTRRQLEEKQLSQFRSFARYVRKHSPYYARIMEQHGLNPDTCVPEDFPVLTKQEVMAHFDEIITDRSITRAELDAFFKNSKDPGELYRNRYYAIHSSGTSGRPAYFVYSERDWARAMAPNSRLKNIRLRRQRLAFYGMTGGHYAGVTFAHSATQSPLLRWAFRIRTYSFNDPIERTVEELNGFQPDILMGYPSSIRNLAIEQAEGRLHLQPRTVQVSGEALNGKDKTYIEQVFGVPVKAVYSCTDHTLMGISIPGEEGIILMEDDLIFELQPDRLLVTNLMNHTLPLIRYEMNDVLVPLKEESSPKSSWPYRRVQEVIGRLENSPELRSKHGAWVTLTQIELSTLLIDGMAGIQLKVTGPEAFEIHYAAEKGLSPQQQARVGQELAAAFERLLRDRDLDNVEFQLLPVPELTIDPVTGKCRLLL